MMLVPVKRVVDCNAKIRLKADCCGISRGIQHLAEDLFEVLPI